MSDLVRHDWTCSVCGEDCRVLAGLLAPPERLERELADARGARDAFAAEAHRLGDELSEVGDALMARNRQLAEARDCGQEGVCEIAPGCQRHWAERNRELVRELAEARELRTAAETMNSWTSDELRRLERELAEAKAAREVQRAHLVEFISSHGELTSEVRRLREQIEFISSHGELTSEVRRLREQMAEARAEIADDNLKLAARRAMVFDLDAQLASAATAIALEDAVVKGDPAWDEAFNDEVRACLAASRAARAARERT